MTLEQLKWTDKQWAAYLGCAVQEVPKFKKYLEEHFCLGICTEGKTGPKYVQIQVRHDTPSGSVRYIPMVTSKPFDLPLDGVIEYANNVFVPSLELNPFAAEIHGIPAKAIQMLHINQKQR